MRVLFQVMFLFLAASPVFASEMYWIDPTPDELNTTIQETLASPTAPPREFFSMNTLYLRDKVIVHVGHDLINQTYVVLPSPNIMKVENLAEGRRRVTIQQYFPDLQEKILSNYNISANKIHFLYIKQYEVYDQDGNLVNKLTIPPGVQYRPPQFYTVEVSKDVSTLSFVFGFVGRTAWSDSGLTADLQGLYKDLREVGIDRDSSLKIDVDPASGVKAYEILTSHENQKLGQLLSDFQHIVAWGRMTQKEDLISKIVDLKNYETVHIDLAKGMEDLKKYPHIFGDPINPKFQTVIKKLSSEKLSEKEYSKEGSANAKLGIGSLFSGDASASKKKSSRMKELVKFDLEGEFYVPKSLNFVVRTNDSFDLLKTLVFQAYDHLEEAFFRMGTGVSLSLVQDGPAFTTKSNSLSAGTAQHEVFGFPCPGESVLAGIKSARTPNFDRSFQHECRDIAYYESTVRKDVCQVSAVVNAVHNSFSFSCPENQFMGSQNSSYSQGDRLFTYQCCSLKTADMPVKRKACTWSGFLNDFNNPVSYSCPAETVLAGVQTEFLPLVTHKKYRKHWWKHRHKKRIVVPQQGDRRYNYLCCSYGLE